LGEIGLPLLPVGLQLLVDRRRSAGCGGGCSSAAPLRAGEVYDRSLR